VRFPPKLGNLTRPAVCDSIEVYAFLAQDSPRPCDDIPGVVWVGILMGVAFLVIAIRAMFGKK
jgi:hypothetical protein